MVKKTVVVTDEMEAKVKAVMKKDTRSYSHVVREALGEFFKIDKDWRHADGD